MKTMISLSLATLGAVFVFGYDWPAADMQVSKTFGQRSGGTFLAGVEVQTLSPVLAAPDAGDVLFVFRPGEAKVQPLPSALGGFVALAHQDNLRSIVSRIQPQGGMKRSYQRGEPLGQAEVQPGASESRHRLFVFDQQLGEQVNPLLIFPPRPDARVPLLFDVAVVPEGQTGAVSLFNQATLAVGYWVLRIDVSDPVTLFPPPGKEKGVEGQRGVYAVDAYLNGTEVFNTNLDSLQEKSGRWQVKGLGAYLDEVVVRDQTWNLGQIFINQGTNILEIVVKDFEGNQTGRTFRVVGSR